MTAYELQTKEELIMRLTKLNRMPSKDELNTEIARLKIALREEKLQSSLKRKENIKDFVPTGDRAKDGYMFLLEENMQLHKELEYCRDLIEEYVKLSPLTIKID